MFLPKYPYTDMHELNLDWMLTVMQEFQSYIDSGLRDYFISQLGPLLLEITYDATRELITLRAEETK